jgi:hypothetical protein
MKSISKSHSILEWLGIIFEERFGHVFNLHQEKNGNLIIKLKSSDNVIEISYNVIFFEKNIQLPCGLWDPSSEGWSSTLGSALPTPGVNSIDGLLIENTRKGYFINYDISGLVYWMLSRHEEVYAVELDVHNRFPATASHAYKHQYLQRPIVDEWLDILGQVIKSTWPNIEIKTHIFKVKLSHDVDIPSRYAFTSVKQMLRNIIVDVIYRHDFLGVILSPYIKLFSGKSLRSIDPYNTFDWIMSVSEKYNLTSAFYFICGGGVEGKDADYQLDSPAIVDLMTRINSRGHEIGLHPSYNCYQDKALILKEANNLKNTLEGLGLSQLKFGGRMHFLRWSHPDTMYSLEAAGMGYDSTLGYADCPGFRCGTCFDYPAIDPIKKQMLNIRIRPLIAMDVSILSNKYLGLEGNEALNNFIHLKNVCRSVEGSYTLLWHNNRLRTRRHRELYLNILSS